MRRALLGLAAAALGTVAAAKLLPLPPDDPFRGSLLLLPWIVLALAAIARAARRRGGPAPPHTAAEALVLGLLVLLVAGRHAWGFPDSDALLAAGFVLLLAHHLAGLLRSLRPLLGRRLPARPSALFFLLPAVVYLALLPWQSEQRPPDGDEPYYLLLAHSLAHDLDVDLANNYAARDWRHFLDRELEPQPGDPRGPHGEIYSRHNFLLPLLLAPAYRLAGTWGALATMALATAAAGWLMLRLAARLFPREPGAALLAWAILVFTPPLLVYSVQVWVEVPAALFLLVALDVILGIDGARTTPGRLLLLGLALTALPVLKIRFALLVLPLLVLAVWRLRSSRRALVGLLAAVVAVGAAILVSNAWIFGNPLKIHSWSELRIAAQPPARFLRGFLGLFWDCGFGLFAVAPLWLLLVPAAGLLAVRARRFLALAAWIGVPYLLAVMPRREWYGGWAPAFRYAVVLLPLLALALVPLLARRRRAGARAIVAALAALTLVLSLCWLVEPGWTYNFADGRSHLLDALAGRFGADVARFFPSMLRPRTASLVWPPATIVLLLVLWWWPRGRRGRPALWGLTALLAFAAAVPIAARTVPTAIVQAEDPQVRTFGGHLYPGRWVIARPRFPAGWTLAPGDRLRAPVVAGGRHVALTLAVELLDGNPRRPLLEVRNGERRLAAWRADRPHHRQLVRLDVASWTAGEPLVLELRGQRMPRDRLLIDWVAFDWQ